MMSRIRGKPHPFCILMGITQADRKTLVDAKDRYRCRKTNKLTITRTP